MLSILIPLYRYDCSQLLDEIHAQISPLGVAYEIVLGDDASGAAYTSLFEGYTARYPSLRLYRAPHNEGASLMRQKLARIAEGDVLLFLDSDITLSSGLLANYMQAHAQAPTAVICGGFIYDAKDCRPNNKLRYHYGMRVEVRPLEVRRKKPYQSFVAMAFMVPRSIFEVCPFPNMGMGYEDAYWGASLRLQGIPLQHIDAPVIHRLKETDSEFLRTTERYIANLYQYRAQFSDKNIRLLETFYRLEKKGWARLLGRIFFVSKPILKSTLRITPRSIGLFQLYKLLYLCSLTHSSRL